MQVIRQYAVPQNGQLIISVPPAFEGQQVEVQLLLAQDVVKPKAKKQPKKGKKTTGLGKLVGSLSHLTPEQNEKIDRELESIRNEWERPIY
ncbi:MAG: hypothetical protein EAZ91_17225 [Cytophagales bacterium]|nr:MAG: hypothetical protein EAZ91_17225 [Cytophagales bacterium]